MNNAERIIDRSIPEPNTGCWIWLGAILPNGYGTITRLRTVKGIRADTVAAHRLSYESFRGPIPDNLVIDHLCRNRLCVNPSHLEAVTIRINILRGIGKAAMLAKQTHCKRGHEFTRENTQIRNNNRSCRTCINENRRYLRKIKREYRMIYE